MARKKHLHLIGRDGLVKIESEFRVVFGRAKMQHLLEVSWKSAGNRSESGQSGIGFVSAREGKYLASV